MTMHSKGLGSAMSSCHFGLILTSGRRTDALPSCPNRAKECVSISYAVSKLVTRKAAPSRGAAAVELHRLLPLLSSHRGPRLSAPSSKIMTSSSSSSRHMQGPGARGAGGKLEP